MPTWLTWFISLLRGYLGIKADIAAKQEQEVGKLKAKSASDDKLLQEVQDNEKLRDANSKLTPDELIKWVREQNRRP